MWKAKTSIAAALMAVAGLSGSAHALEADSNITTDTTWTKADSPVYLEQPVFVGGGASLTIEAGVIVVTPEGAGNNDDVDGGLVIERDAQIFVLGTEEQPVIMTSQADVETWNGTQVGNPDGDQFQEITTMGDPTTGDWRQAVQEWRNLTMMGNAVIGASAFEGNDVTGSDGVSNPETPDGTVDRQMEGLLQGEGTTDDSVFFGGADDNDDSGTINYLSLRYGGRVLGEGNELNGMSMGGIGRGTDLDYIEIMNNVDDGIEFWGGTANLSHFQIWNIGDDSLDLDEGWRGKVQFGLIVQGFSTSAAQGSGVGDNALEMDGSEQSDAQPRSTVAMHNLTVIGQPGADGLTTWRDNNRVQFHKSVFMSTGTQPLVRLDNIDGDGGKGYGHDGSHTWGDVWQTAETNVSPNGVNEGSGDFAPSELYKSQQSDGISANLADIRDSVVWNYGSLFSNASSLSSPFDPSSEISAASANNVLFDSSAANASANLPVQSITRDAPQQVGPDSVTIRRVTDLDPRAANDATSIDGPQASKDGFWTPTDYRGAFSPNHNWAAGWSAADAYGFFPGDQQAADPEASFQVQVTTTTFQTQQGQSYVIECTTDGRNWDPVKVVEGDGTLKTVANEISVDENKFYRVRVQ